MSRQRALYRARRVKEALLDYGVPEVRIHLQNGRPTYGEDTWNACHPVAVMSHHTASYPTEESPTPCLSLVKTGRSDLPGPLCNGYAGVDLVYRIITMGWANHSGEGGPWLVRGPAGSYLIPKDIGRPYIWGTEFEGGYNDAQWDKTYHNPKTGKKMDFHEFMARCNAGLVDAIWDINSRGEKVNGLHQDLATYHGEHGKPWAVGRKVDRHWYVEDVTRGRRAIRQVVRRLR